MVETENKPGSKRRPLSEAARAQLARLEREEFCKMLFEPRLRRPVTFPQPSPPGVKQ